MFGGIRENINPTIAAVATIMITVSVLRLITLKLLPRRNARLIRNVKSKPRMPMSCGNT